MLRRRFGRTGLELPVFSCGGMRYQQSWSRGAKVTGASDANLRAITDRAFAVGINHFETARGYGTSEAQLGRALAGRERNSYVLQTKIMPPANARTFEAQLEESFALLRVEVLDLFAFHGVNTPTCLTNIFKSGGCYEVAERFRRRGRIRHIGLSTHAPTAMILEAIETGAFDYVNLHYYYVLQDNCPVLEAARRRDLGVFIISPTDKGGRLQAPSEKLRGLCAPLSPIVFNDLWCLAHPEIHTLSIGAARTSDFDEHLKALPLLDETADLLPPIVARLEAAYRDALGEDFARRWHEGLREWTELPGGVNVRKILWLDNLARAYDLIDYARERYATMSPEDHWVPGARATAGTYDEAALTAALPASPFKDELAQRLREADRRLSSRR